MAHCNIGVTEDLFNASLTSQKDDFFLDSRETCHMSFRRYLFEEFTDNVDGEIYFSINPNSSHPGLVPLGPNFLVFQTFFYLIFYTFQS